MTLSLALPGKTIVNVAPPSIKANLGFSDTSVAWVGNRRLIAYGSVLPLLHNDVTTR
jgi:hypothetical protein